MKKLITLCAMALTFSGALFAQNGAQLSTPLVSKNGEALRTYKDYEWHDLRLNGYKTKDIKGNEIDIQAILAEKKTVLIDFSTVWCGPCWAMHQGHMLDKFYERFGPQGTQRKDMVVLWVEGEGAKKKAIQASHKNWTLKHGTTEEVPYPIISDAELAKKLRVRLTGWPTVVLLSPTGQYTYVEPFFVDAHRTEIDNDRFAALLKDVSMRPLSPRP